MTFFVKTISKNSIPPYSGIESEFLRVKYKTLKKAKQQKLGFVDLTTLKFNFLRQNGYIFRHGSNAIPKTEQERKRLKRLKKEWKLQNQ